MATTTKSTKKRPVLGKSSKKSTSTGKKTGTGRKRARKEDDSTVETIDEVSSVTTKEKTPQNGVQKKPSVLRKRTRISRLNSRAYEALDEKDRRSTKIKVVYPGCPATGTWTLKDLYKFHQDTPVLENALREDCEAFANELRECLEDINELDGNTDAIKFLGLETSARRKKALEDLLECDPKTASLEQLRTKMLDPMVGRLMREAGVKNANPQAKALLCLLFERLVQRSSILAYNNRKFDGKGKTFNMAHVRATERELRGSELNYGLPLVPDMLRNTKRRRTVAQANSQRENENGVSHE